MRGLASSGRILVGFITLCISSLALAAGPGWYNNFEQAVQVARQQGRPIFVDFSTSWCSVCKQMDRTTLSDPAIISRLDNFVKVKVDGDARQDLCSAYGVEAYPTFIHLSPTGQIVEKREGSMRVQEMAGALDRTWQNVSRTMAIAQVSRNAQQAESSNNREPKVTTAEAKLLPVKESATRENDSRDSGRENSRQSAERPSREPLYNTDDAQLQGSVYAMGAGPTSERRSRFGGSAASTSGLRELAEATAQPGSIEDSGSKDESDSKNAEESRSSEKKEVARADDSDSSNSDKLAKGGSDEKSNADSSSKSDEAKSKKDTASESQKSDVKVAEATSVDSKTKQALAKPAVVVADAAPSPVIDSRLSGLSEEALPKPLLSRSASGATQAMTPAPAVAKSTTGDPLATIRRIQKDDTGAQAPAVSEKTQEIAAEKDEAAAKPKTEVAEKKSSEENSREEKSTGDKSSREIASATEPNRNSEKSESAKASDSKKSDNDSASSKSESKEVAKTSEGATKSDIERWMKDADSKLIDQRKKEARAMYSKVVDKDPDNKFGKSDMAYVKMVSLIVDKDSDLLRRQAYNKIKEFEARFPNSDHKDYYTLIRAILAVDLGETNEAHKLLGTYAERFPDSKYVKMAHDTWKSLPPVKKSSKSKSSADSGKRKSSSDS